MKKIYKKDIHPIALGAQVLGTGGGGDPKIGKLLIEHAMSDTDYIELMDVEELEDDAIIASLAYVGAPIIGLEKLENVSEILSAFDKLENYLNKKIVGVHPGEIGGANSLVPFHVALARNIPLVDCDGLGRAFPYIHQSTFNLHKVSGPPVVQADEKGNVLVYETISDEWLGRLVSATVVPMGGQCVIADKLTGQQVKKAAIRDTITLAYKIGTSILEKTATSVTESLLAACNGILLFQGKIVDVLLSNEGRFNTGKCIIEGLGTFKNRTIEIDYQNEFLLAMETTTEEKRPIAMTPDLISLVHSETAIPIGAETLQYGTLITVIGIPADPQWQTKAGLDLVGIQAFGYDMEYRPMDELNTRIEG